MIYDVPKQQVSDVVEITQKILHRTVRDHLTQIRAFNSERMSTLQFQQASHSFLKKLSNYYHCIIIPSADLFQILFNYICGVNN